MDKKLYVGLFCDISMVYQLKQHLNLWVDFAGELIEDIARSGLGKYLAKLVVSRDREVIKNTGNVILNMARASRKYNSYSLKWVVLNVT